MRFKHFKKRIFRAGLVDIKETIDPDEIFLDSSNLPKFNTHQFEGRLERPIKKGVFLITTVVFSLIGIIFAGKLWLLQIHQGEAFEIRSENNHLRHTTIFANRGLILDRLGEKIAENKLNPNGDFSLREYSQLPGLSHVLGFINILQKTKMEFITKKNLFQKVAWKNTITMN